MYSSVKALLLTTIYHVILHSNNLYAIGLEILDPCRDNSTINYDCSDFQSLTIWSDVLSFSCFINNKRKILNNCKNPYEVKNINIFALDLIRIDENIIADGEDLQLNIIAPQWEVLGKRKIILDGSEGQDFLKRARDAFFDGNGEHGKPGTQGGSGGSFFGVGERFVNAENLIIRSNGGNGGSGQDGGNGANGIQGTSAANDTYPIMSTSCKERICRKEHVIFKNLLGKKELFKCKFLKEYIPALNLTDLHATLSGLKMVQDYLLAGKNAKTAGDGGNGGMRGKPGLPGVIVLFNINETNDHLEILTETRGGLVGKKGGKGGHGGKGFPKGHDLLIKRFCILSNVKNITTTKNEKPYRVDFEYHFSGSQIINGRNGKDGVTPDLSNQTRPLFNQTRVLSSLNVYKRLIRTNLTESRQKFLTRFETSENITNLYNTYQFFLELVALKNVNNSIPYRKLLYAVRKFAETNEEIRNSTQEKIVLKYLCAAFAARINTIDIYHSYIPIFGINNFLGRFKFSIETLLDKKNTMSKLWLVKDYIRTFLKDVDTKIIKGKYFISKDVTARIEFDKEKINSEITQLLVRNNVTLTNNKVRKNHNLISEENSLRDCIRLRVVCGICELVNEGLSFLAEFLGTAGAITQKINNIQSLSMNKQKPINIPETENAIQICLYGLKNITEREVSRLNRLLDEIYLITKADNRSFIEIINLVNHTREKLRYVDTFVDVQKIRNELIYELEKKHENGQNLLRMKKQILLNDHQSNSYNANGAKKIRTNELKTNFDTNMKKIRQLVNMPLSLVEFMSTVRADVAIEKIFNKALFHLDNELILLKENEINITNIVVSMLGRMELVFELFEDKLAKKSNAYFDVNELKVESIINSLTFEINQINDLFKNKSKLEYCLSSINKGMTVLVEIYKGLQNADMLRIWQHSVENLDSDKEIVLSNSTYKNVTNYSESVIRQNLVFHQYKVAVSLLRQHLFPFTSFYLEKTLSTRFLTYLGSNNSYEVDVEAQVREIENALVKFKTFHTKLDKHKGKGLFSGLYYPASSPFFVWKNEEHKDVINKLLSGKTVTLDADVLKSELKHFAIKCKSVSIDLRIKKRNKTRQAELTKVLNGFHINATHLGYSQYRFGDKLYMITTRSLNIWHSLALDSNKIPVKRGGACRKIDNNVILISPYSLWNVQLVNNNLLNFTFDELQTFRDEINVELGGYGEYLRDSVLKEKDIKIDQYYSSTDIIY